MNKILSLIVLTILISLSTIVVLGDNERDAVPEPDATTTGVVPEPDTTTTERDINDDIYEDRDTPGSTSNIGTISKTSYEEVKEFGYNPNERKLEAIVSIKNKSGYGGFEFVSFYVDWNQNGYFEKKEYAGTGIVYVSNPGKTAYLPISYATSIYMTVPPYVSGIFKARAILSWYTPSTAPNYIPTYGNKIDRNIKIEKYS